MYLWYEKPLKYVLLHSSTIEFYRNWEFREGILIFGVKLQRKDRSTKAIDDISEGEYVCEILRNIISICEKLLVKYLRKKRHLYEILTKKYENKNFWKICIFEYL